MIGILTFNRAINYGALLQAYALKEKVSDFCECEIINYLCEPIERFYNPFNQNIIKGMVCFIEFNKKNKKAKKFIEDISGKKLYTKDEVGILPYEKIIVGSDQVWNYNCSGKDSTFLLPQFEGKKYSYSASFGVSELPQENVDYFKEKLSQFEHIAVREDSGRRICEKQLDLTAQVTLDPTLLLTKDDWREKFNIKSTKKEYVLVYSLGLYDEVHKIAKKISKEKRIPIYNLSVIAKDFFGDKVIKSAGPKEWAELFYNAKFVVTDSFHGTAFAVNFNKPFYSIAKNERSSRIVDLLNKLGLQSRLNPILGEVNSDTDIDYVSVNKTLEEERKKSIAFIEKIIND